MHSPLSSPRSETGEPRRPRQLFPEKCISAPTHMALKRRIYTTVNKEASFCQAREGEESWNWHEICKAAHQSSRTSAIGLIAPPRN